jgi:HAMP domain-containing protein
MTDKTPAKTVQKNKDFRSLTFTLVLAFFTLGVVVILVSCSLYVYFNIQAQQQVITSQQDLIARDATNPVKGFIQEKFSVLETTASLSSTMTATKEEQKNILDKLMGRESSFRQLILLNGQNQTLVQTSRLSQSMSKINNRLDDDLLDGARNGRYAGDIYIDAVTSEPMMIMAVPVRDVFGDFQGILAAEVNLKFMWELIDSIKVGKTGLAYVVDKRGDLIAFADISRVLKGENLAQLDEVAEFISGEKLHSNEVEISKGIEGTYNVISHVHLEMPNWAVVIEIPISEAYEPIYQQVGFIALTVLLTIILTIVFGFYLSKRIIKPIIILRDAALKVGEGKLDTRIEIKTKNEIGELASAFSQMIENLKKSGAEIEKYSKNLEKQIADRTKELKTKNDELERFNKLAIGRELAMIELKKRIAELENRNKKARGGGKA